MLSYASYAQRRRPLAGFSRGPAASSGEYRRSKEAISVSFGKRSDSAREEKKERRPFVPPVLKKNERWAEITRGGGSGDPDTAGQGSDTTGSLGFPN
jgi:hypothetical protein